MSRFLWVTAALALAACSQAVERQGAVGGTGGLRVSVHDMTEAEVKEVHIELVPDAGAPNPAPGALHFVLRHDDPGVRDDSGSYVVWTWTAEMLPAGAYLASAKAYDIYNPQLGFGILPIFESASVPTTVQQSPTATVNLFMRQGVGESDFEPPHVTAIRFDRKPEKNDVATITVWGGGGEGALSLEAQGAGDFGKRGPPPNWDGKGTGNAKDAGGASIDWMPDDSGDLPLSLILLDEDGNRSTLVLVVEVDDARGDAEFNIAFNHAPWSILQSESLVHPPTASIEFTARYGDVESNTELVDYEWDVSDCEAAGFVAAGAVDGVISGSIEGDETESHQVELSMTASPLPDPPPTCEVILEVSDRGLPGNAGAVSTSTRSILVTLGQVHPCIGELTACGGVCVDLETDDNNCGACGNVCGQDQTCVAGTCQCDDEELTACGQLCVDLQNDDDHCGACDKACEPGLVCEVGLCDFPYPVPQGTYAYQTTHINNGITNPMHAAWHPSGAYALITEETNRVFKYVPNQDDPINPVLELVADAPEVSNLAWNGLTFLPDGSRAILYGQHTSSGNRTGYLYVWDHESEQLSLHPNGTLPDSRIKGHAWAPDGTLWFLGHNGLSSSSRRALFYSFDPDTGPSLNASGMPSSTSECNWLAWVKDHLGSPMMMTICNTYAESIFPGNSSMEPYTNLSATIRHMAGRQQGDFALALPPSGSSFRRFENGSWSSQSVVSGPSKISFSPSGKRALLYYRKTNTNGGSVWEYRHPLLDSTDVVSVEIPYANFIQNTDTVNLNDAAWKRDCDEGIIVGGNTGSSASGYIIEFRVTNGRACSP